jgi:putative ABC transport system permease protein
MISSIAWKMAWRNLGRNRRRNITTGAAIAFGYVGLLLLGGYIVRVEHFLRSNGVYLAHTGHISIYKKNGLERFLTKPSRYNLTLAEQRKIFSVISHDPEIEFTGKYLRTAGLAGNGCKSFPFFATGIDMDAERQIHVHAEVTKWVPELNRVIKGIGLWELPQSDSTTYVTLSYGLARLLGKPSVHSDFPENTRVVAQLPDCTKPGSQAEIARDSNIQLAARSFHGDFSAIDAEIASHYSTGVALTEDDSLIAPLEALQKLYDTDDITYVALYLKQNVWVHSYLSRLEKRLRDAGLDVSLYPFDSDETGPFYVGIVNFLLVMATFFVFLVFGVVALSIINALAMSIIERTREIGTLRSVGYSREFIAGVFARETAMLSLFSLCAGALINEIISSTVNSLNIRFRPPGLSGDMQFMLTPNAALYLSLGAVILILSYITARKTAMVRTKQKVAELLTAGTG